jgi:hypothetical protein
VFLTLGSWKSLVPVVALQAALLRPSNEDRIDVRAAIEELRKVSFIDIHNGKDGTSFLGIPLAASEFSKKKLTTAYGRSQVDNDAAYLRRFGAMQLVDLKHGLEPRVHRFFGAVSDSINRKRTTLDQEYPILELIARHYAPAWLLIAHLLEEAGTDPTGERTLEVLSRYLESGPSPDEKRKTHEMMARVYRRRKDWLGFIEATVRIAESQDADLVAISGAANTLNSLKREIDSLQKRDFVRRLITAMEPKIIDADATDCSRLAWLYLQDGREQRAITIAKAGLKLEPDNDYCLNLLRKLETRAPPGP